MKFKKDKKESKDSSEQLMQIIYIFFLEFIIRTNCNHIQLNQMLLFLYLFYI